MDTGVLVSAAIRPESVPALALEKAFFQFDVCASPATLAELESVLLRAKFDRYVSCARRNLFLDGFRAQIVLFEVTQEVTDCPDPKDNMFLALAETAQAELIISSDPHLTQMHPWREIPIIPPAAFLVGIH
ncbi:putative toxin-antitoxin system toxin component, PIN family [Thiocystis minor]|uniref:putative toxin-antitoxin system toxin component, PIN family n=1 Tax=Thiocystis minor TaxID=61597 RepID=UPI001914A91A|nr:putative toxin-antitoxin system toxin component, PIN family [Thiocystis minor]